MATYKKQCVHCDKLIDGDAKFCPYCGSHTPFGFKCPTCLHEISREQNFCDGCGRPLKVKCPHCGKDTFTGEICEHCGGSLLIKCGNPLCGSMQFFDNEKCTACGKDPRHKYVKTGLFGKQLK